MCYSAADCSDLLCVQCCAEQCIIKRMVAVPMIADTSLPRLQMPTGRCPPAWPSACCPHQSSMPSICLSARDGLFACSGKVRFERIIRNAQNSICDAVTRLDGKPFHEDAWTRADGGGGVSRVLQDGNVFEKAGVNVSVVYGSMPASAYRAATERGAEVAADAPRVPFFAAGISSVMHTRNPHAPTMHFNYRCAHWAALAAMGMHRLRCEPLAAHARRRW